MSPQISRLAFLSLFATLFFSSPSFSEDRLRQAKNPSVCGPEIVQILSKFKRDDPVRLARRGHHNWDLEDFAHIVGTIAKTVDLMYQLNRHRVFIEGEDLLSVAIEGIHKKSKDPQYTWEDILKMSRVIAKRRILDLVKQKSISKENTVSLSSLGEYLDSTNEHSIVQKWNPGGIFAYELGFDELEREDFFHRIYSVISEEEKEILQALYLEGESAASIANRFNVKPARIIYLKDRLNKRLKVLLETHQP